MDDKNQKIFIIEDNVVWQQSFRKWLGSDYIFETASDTEKAKQIFSRFLPDIVLLDLGLRSLNSLHVVEIVKKEFPGAKIIVMDLAPVQADILQYVKAGANGFILKDASLNELLVTIRNVSKGETVLPPLLVDSLFSQIVDHAIGNGKSKLMEAVRMTKREREVIGLLSDGLSNKEIAQKMHISTFTVKSHIHNIMEKLALHTRLEIANYSYTVETLKTVAKSISTINN